MSKLTDFLTGGSEEPKEIEGEEEFYTTTKEEFHSANGMAGSKMMLLEPRAYSESQQIADYLKNRSAVVVNLKRVTPDQAKRIIDFLSGTIYAISGQLQKLGGGIFLATPNNYNIEGTITDEKAEKVARNGNGKKASDDEADFF
ncbi:MAG: cell division protein SepF [Bacilli bacterium]|nr:cell division protein SepF [Bacilli bacterium]